MGEARWLGGVGQGRADHPWSAAVERGRSTLPVTGDRRIGRGAFLSGPRSRPSGLRFGYSGTSTGSGALPSVLCHQFSHQPSPPLSPPFRPLFSPPYLPFFLCFFRYSTGVHFISRLNRRLKKVTWRKPQAKAMSSTLRSPSRSSRRAAWRRSSLTNALKL